MIVASKAQIKTIHILLSQWAKARGFAVEAGEKAAIVLEFSGGRAESTTCLTPVEAEALITALRLRAAQRDPADVMRKKIIHYAHEMKWELPNGKADIARIDGWCRSYGYLKKPLNEYTARELPRLVSQMEAVHVSFLKGLNR